MSLSNILTRVSDVVLSDLGQKILSGLGISVFTFGTTQFFFDQAMQLVYQNWSMMGSVMYLFGISGVDEALSMVFSAIAVRVALNSAKVGLTKA